MLKQLQEHYDTLEKNRLALIRTIRGLTPRQLDHKPGTDRWSILEDFQHLVLAEKSTLLEAGAVLDSAGKKPDMLEVVLQILDHDVVVDVPDPAMVPDGNADLEDLIRDWEASRKRLFHHLEDFGPEDLETPVASHPVTGPLSVIDLLRLISAHVGHHCRRIEAAIARG